MWEISLAPSLICEYEYKNPKQVISMWYPGMYKKDSYFDQIYWIKIYKVYLPWEKSINVNSSHYHIRVKSYSHLDGCGRNVW